jgi:hypothetical protein
MKQRLAYLKEMCEVEMFMDTDQGLELIAMIEQLQKEAVKFLRKKTGCGMLDCKSMLERAEWDIELAEWCLLKEKEMSKHSIFTQRSLL